MTLDELKPLVGKYVDVQIPCKCGWAPNGRARVMSVDEQTGVAVVPNGPGNRGENVGITVPAEHIRPVKNPDSQWGR